MISNHETCCCCRVETREYCAEWSESEGKEPIHVDIHHMWNINTFSKVITNDQRQQTLRTYSQNWI